MTFYPQIQNSPGAFWFFLQLHFWCRSCQTAAAVKVKVQLLQLQVQLLLRLPDSLKVHLKLQFQLLQSLCQLKLLDCSLGVQLQGKLTWTNYDHFRVLAMMWSPPWGPIKTTFVANNERGAGFPRLSGTWNLWCVTKRYHDPLFTNKFANPDVDVLSSWWWCLPRATFRDLVAPRKQGWTAKKKNVLIF